MRISGRNLFTDCSKIPQTISQDFIVFRDKNYVDELLVKN
jgi:hypothetical protein